MFSLLSFGFQWRLLEPDQTGKVQKIDILQQKVNALEEQIGENFTVDEDVAEISSWNGRMMNGDGRVIGELPNQYYYGWAVMITTLAVGLRLDIPLRRMASGSTY